MQVFTPSNSQLLSRLGKAGSFIFFMLLINLLIESNPLYAQNPSSTFQLSFKNNLLTISAKNADLKNVLINLADKTNISIAYPGSLEKKVTLNKNRIPVREALQRLLKGLNYAIIYSGSKKNKSVISDVLIFKKSKKTAQLRVNERRIANRISSYERQLVSLKERLSKVEAGSNRAKNYTRRINLIENNIEKLRRQLY